VREPAKRLPIEEKVRVVLAVLGGEMTASEAVRRHGVSVQAVLTWRNKFLDAGQESLADRIPGPGKSAGSAGERRLKLEHNQLKLALAEATVGLRIWQKGADYAEAVPSKASWPYERQRVCRFRGSPVWRAFRAAAITDGWPVSVTATRAKVPGGRERSTALRRWRRSMSRRGRRGGTARSPR
jgi:transposase